MQTRAPIPDEIDALKALVADLGAEMQALRSERDALKQAGRDDKQEIQHLKLLLAKPQRMMIGQKSERLARQIDQLQLELEELHINQGEREPASQAPAAAARPAPQRRPLPEHLPRDIEQHLSQEAACPDCGSAWKVWARTSARYWSSCRPASRWCAMCARSWPARAAIAWRKPRLPAARLPAAMPARGSWRTCS